VPALWALWRSLRDLLRGKRGLYVWLLAANAAIFPFLPFSVYQEPLGVMRFSISLIITVVLYAAAYRLKRALMYSTFWLIFGLWLILSR
jgi:hypothetical protein